MTTLWKRRETNLTGTVNGQGWQRGRTALVLSLTAFVVSCAGADETELLTDPPELGPSLPAPSLDEFADSVRVTESQGEYYLLEGDMIADYEGMVRYYEHRFHGLVEKSVGIRVTVGSTVVFDTRPSHTIRYCLTGGWGAPNPTQSQVQSLLDEAAGAWQSAAHVYFFHETSLDGAASCVLARVSDGSVDIRVTQSGSGTSSAALPGFTASNQLLKVGTTFTSGIAKHELGHVIGLLHETDHSQETLGCTNENFSGSYPNPGAVNGPGDLTSAYDSGSIMQYTNGGAPVCVIPASGGGTLATATLSSSDGVGARTLYGPPPAWFVAYGAPLLLL
jgi:metallopeptidase family M12-like protein